MKLSATNGPLYHFYGDDILATLSHVKEAGFRYVDISFWSRYEKPESRYFSTDNAVLAEEYKRALGETELIPVASHEPWTNLIADPEAQLRKDTLAIDLAGRLGIPTMTVHHGASGDYMSREEFMEKNAEGFKKLIPLAEKANIRLLIENLAWQGVCKDAHMATADDLIEMLDRINHPLFGVCWDTGHANLCDLDQYAELKKLGHRLENLHVHDNFGGTKAPNADLHQFPFFGNINFDGIMTALLEIGYKGTFNFETDNPIRRTFGVPFYQDGKEVRKLAAVPPSIRLLCEKLQYKIGKHFLETYNCFEA